MNNVKHQEDKVYLTAKQPDYSFCINDEKWVLDRNNIVNVRYVSRFLHPKLTEGYINTLAYYACKYSPSYVIKINNNIHDFIKKMTPAYIEETVILNYKDTLPKQRVQYLVTLRSFFKTWYSLGYYGVDEKVISLFNAMKLKVKEAGDAVKNENPEQGPLTDPEHYTFNRAIRNAYEFNKINLYEFSLALLVSFTGRRPAQITSLKFKDIVRESTINGKVKYYMNFPRIKQGLEFRKSFRKLILSEYLFNIVHDQAVCSVKLVEETIGRTLISAEKNEVPIFMSKSGRKITADEKDILGLLSSDRLHVPKNVVDYVLSKIIKIEGVISERTGESMKINARRLRYTLGTRLARDGYSVQIISELLDHSSIYSAGIYVENLPDNVEKINQAVSAKLAFLANVFLGKSNGDTKFNNSNLLKNRACLSCTDFLEDPCHSCVYFRITNNNIESDEAFI